MNYKTFRKYIELVIAHTEKQIELINIEIGKKQTKLSNAIKYKQDFVPISVIQNGIQLRIANRNDLKSFVNDLCQEYMHLSCTQQNFSSLRIASILSGYASPSQSIILIPEFEQIELELLK